MNIHGICAIYTFEMGRTLRTLGQSIAAPVLSTVLYFIVFGPLLDRACKLLMAHRTVHSLFRVLSC